MLDAMCKKCFGSRWAAYDTPPKTSRLEWKCVSMWWYCQLGSATPLLFFYKLSIPGTLCTGRHCIDSNHPLGHTCSYTFVVPFDFYATSVYRHCPNSANISFSYNHRIYTVSQKKACDYIFCNNWNNECPIIIIFGTLISETICHRMVVSFPTSSI